MTKEAGSGESVQCNSYTPCNSYTVDVLGAVVEARGLVHRLAVEACWDPAPVWRILNHMEERFDKEIEGLLRADEASPFRPATTHTGALTLENVRAWADDGLRECERAKRRAVELADLETRISGLHFEDEGGL